MEKGESALIRWFRSHTPRPSQSVKIGLGDDMAMVRADGVRILVTADMLMDGVDFDSAACTPRAIGRKALAVSLSDCAAMAVRPRWAILSVALPNAWSMEYAQELYHGAQELAREFQVDIVGGDTNSWDRPLVIDSVVVAEPWPRARPVTRNGMRPGDLLVVTGSLGGSLAGHHLSFAPRIREARWLAEHLRGSLHAMIDLSDGLSTDARHLADESGCGIEFDSQSLEALATVEASTAAKSSGRSVLDHVLNDGEDYELLFAVRPAAWTRLCDSCEGRRAAGETGGPCFHAIGKAVKQRGVRLLTPEKAPVEIEPRGWQHFK